VYRNTQSTVHPIEIFEINKIHYIIVNLCDLPLFILMLRAINRFKYLCNILVIIVMKWHQIVFNAKKLSNRMTQDQLDWKEASKSFGHGKFHSKYFRSPSIAFSCPSCYSMCVGVLYHLRDTCASCSMCTQLKVPDVNQKCTRQ
jgi:hypothetical protein